MSVEFSLVEAPFPYVCAVYRCRCGQVATRHGEEAATAPSGWHTVGPPAGEDEVVLCPACAARSGGVGTQVSL